MIKKKANLGNNDLIDIFGMLKIILLNYRQLAVGAIFGSLIAVILLSFTPKIYESTAIVYFLSKDNSINSIDNVIIRNKINLNTIYGTNSENLSKNDQVYYERFSDSAYLKLVAKADSPLKAKKQIELSLAQIENDRNELLDIYTQPLKIELATYESRITNFKETLSKNKINNIDYFNSNLVWPQLLYLENKKNEIAEKILKYNSDSKFISKKIESSNAPINKSHLRKLIFGALLGLMFSALVVLIKNY